VAITVTLQTHRQLHRSMNMYNIVSRSTAVTYHQDYAKFI